MDKPAEHEAAYNTDQPQGEQNNEQCPQHRLTLDTVFQISLFSKVPPEKMELQEFESGVWNCKLL